jgi:ferrochelatase
MSRFTAPDHRHGEGGHTGVLLVNLGTPEAPTPAAVRRFLDEFLSDPRVVEAPRLIWWLALHGFILRVRPRRSAKAYQQIWTPQGSPLLLHGRELTAKVGERLGSRCHVALGMTYGSPSIPVALRSLRDAGARRLLILPLYPQYSGTTTASVFDRVTSELQSWRWVPEFRFINHYFREPAYLSAVARSVAEHWQQHERKHLLFSFHSIPERYFRAGDPYFCQCQETARRVAAALDLTQQDWSVSFQSQLPRQEWLKPYTDEWLLEAARAGRRKVTVVCPGFASDCLETLEEIALRNREAFLGAGGEAYDYVPALNARSDHAELLADLITRHARDWDLPAQEPDAAELKQARERALSLGAGQ